MVFCTRVMMLPPLTYRINVTAALLPSLYVVDLDAATEALLLHVTMKCVIISCTLLDEPFPLPEYAVNPSFAGAAADKRRRNVRGGEGRLGDKM